MSESSSDDPFVLFAQWFDEAGRSEPRDPNAMAVATVDGDGQPSLRMVLLKGVDARGFVFYTNLESQKGTELAANPKAALCFYWKSLSKQVRVLGPVEQVADEEADEYYASRPRGSQIGAWASKQSRLLEGRFELEAAVARYTAKFGLGKIPRPDHWSGFRIVPKRFEFWHERPFRLHERLVFEAHGGAWNKSRLYP